MEQRCRLICPKKNFAAVAEAVATMPANPAESFASLLQTQSEQLDADAVLVVIVRPLRRLCEVP